MGGAGPLGSGPAAIPPASIAAERPRAVGLVRDEGTPRQQAPAAVVRGGVPHGDAGGGKRCGAAAADEAAVRRRRLNGSRTRSAGRPAGGASANSPLIDWGGHSFLCQGLRTPFPRVWIKTVAKSDICSDSSFKLQDLILLLCGV